MIACFPLRDASVRKIPSSEAQGDLLGAEQAIRELERLNQSIGIPLFRPWIECAWIHFWLAQGNSAQAVERVKRSLIAQDVLEPVLRAQAERAEGNLRYGTECVGFEQDEEGITAIIHERVHRHHR